MANYSKDKVRRKRWQAEELSALVFKAIARESGIKYSTRQRGMIQSDKAYSLTRLRNCCVLTGNGRAVTTKLRASRHVIRTWANWGELPGLRQGRW